MMHGRWPRLLARQNQLISGQGGGQTGAQLIWNAATRAAAATRPASTQNADLAERYADKLKSRVGVSVQGVRAQTADGNADAFRQKYAEKLKQKAESLGVTVEELEKKATLERQARERGALLTAREKAMGVPEASVEMSQSATAATAKSASPKEGPNGVKPLEQIMKLDMVMDKDAETIGQLWNERHAGRRGLSAVLPADTYRRLLARARDFPSFVLPLPRDEGAEFFWLQFSGHQCYFTSLAEFKLHGASARPYLILTHYPELSNSKQIVLMRGEFGDVSDNDQGPTNVNNEDAQLLVYMLQNFYVTGSEEKQRLVEQFHREPASFNYQTLLDAASQLG